jgi:hypothetical protein
MMDSRAIRRSGSDSSVGAQLTADMEGAVETGRSGVSVTAGSRVHS